jgi:hypothetical protein
MMRQFATLLCLCVHMCTCAHVHAHENLLGVKFDESSKEFYASIGQIDDTYSIIKYGKPSLSYNHQIGVQQSCITTRIYGKYAIVTKLGYQLLGSGGTVLEQGFKINGLSSMYTVATWIYSEKLKALVTIGWPTPPVQPVILPRFDNVNFMPNINDDWPEISLINPISGEITSVGPIDGFAFLMCTSATSSTSTWFHYTYLDWSDEQYIMSYNLLNKTEKTFPFSMDIHGQVMNMVSLPPYEDDGGGGGAVQFLVVTDRNMIYFFDVDKHLHYPIAKLDTNHGSALLGTANIGKDGKFLYSFLQLNGKKNMTLAKTNWQLIFPQTIYTAFSPSS